MQKNATRRHERSLFPGQYVDLHLDKIDFWETVPVNRKLNDGFWHQATLELKLGQIKITIDGDTFMYDVTGEMGPWEHVTHLYVGGLPEG